MGLEKNIAGEQNENLAVKFLRRRGYMILARRFRTKLGEIDIIAKDNDALIFIEVRSRSYTDFGAPCESINRKKQMHIINSAFIYLAKYRLEDADIRFDVVAILKCAELGAIKIEHFKDAFGGDGHAF